MEQLNDNIKTVECKENNKKIQINLNESQQQLKEFIESYMKIEFQKYKEMQNSKVTNYGNGYRTVSIPTEHGNIPINVPRLRTGSFKSIILDIFRPNKLLKILSTVLYGHGLSSSRISAFIKEFLYLDISKQRISEINKSLDNNINKYDKKTYFDKDFVAIFIDGKYFSVRDVNKHKSPLLSAIGVTREGEKIQICMEVYKSESKENMTSFLKLLRTKTYLDNQLFVIDGSRHIASAITEQLPNSKIQRCLVHVIRNLKSSLRAIASTNEINNIALEIEDVFTNSSHENFMTELKEVVSCYPKYAMKIKSVLKDKNIYTFLTIDSKFSHKIKTTNLIEQYHANLEAVTHQHKTYPDRSSLLRALILEVERFNTNLQKVDFSDNEPTVIVEDITVLFEELMLSMKQEQHTVLKIYNSTRLIFDQEISIKELDEIKSIIKPKT